jgi:hypothetical protein
MGTALQVPCAKLTIVSSCVEMLILIAFVHWIDSVIDVTSKKVSANSMRVSMVGHVCLRRRPIS